MTKRAVSVLEMVTFVVIWGVVGIVFFSMDDPSPWIIVITMAVVYVTFTAFRKWRARR